MGRAGGDRERAQRDGPGRRADDDIRRVRAREGHRAVAARRRADHGARGCGARRALQRGRGGDRGRAGAAVARVGDRRRCRCRRRCRRRRRLRSGEGPVPLGAGGEGEGEAPVPGAAGVAASVGRERESRRRCRRASTTRLWPRSSRTSARWRRMSPHDAPRAPVEPGARGADADPVAAVHRVAGGGCHAPRRGQGPCRREPGDDEDERAREHARR